MAKLWEAYVFWMNIYGTEILGISTAGAVYYINKRLALLAHSKWLKKYQLPIND